MRTSRRRPAVLLLLVWLTLCLSACGRMTAKVDVHPDDSLDVAYDISVPENAPNDAAKKVDEQCASRFQGIVQKPKPASYRRDGRVGCRVEGFVPSARIGSVGVALRHEDGKVHFKLVGVKDLQPTKEVAAQAGQWSVDVRVTFRGKVVSHSGTSTVQGRTVVWTDPADLSTGFEAVAEEPGLLDRSPGEWAAIAAGLLALVGFLAWTIRDTVRRRPRTHPAPWGGPTHEVRPRSAAPAGEPGVTPRVPPTRGPSDHDPLAPTPQDPGSQPPNGTPPSDHG